MKATTTYSVRCNKHNYYALLTMNGTANAYLQPYHELNSGVNTLMPFCKKKALSLTRPKGKN